MDDMSAGMGVSMCKPLLSVAFLSALVATAAAEDYVTYREYMPMGIPPRKENPLLQTGTSVESGCISYYRRGDFAFWILESDAVAKEKRFGASTLDADEMKYVMNVDARRRACLELLGKKGMLSWKDTVLYMLGKLY